MIGHVSGSTTDLTTKNTKHTKKKIREVFLPEAFASFVPFVVIRGTPIARLSNASLNSGLMPSRTMSLIIGSEPLFRFTAARISCAAAARV